MQLFVTYGVVIFLSAAGIGLSREPHRNERTCPQFVYEHELLQKYVKLSLEYEELEKSVLELQAYLRTIMFSAKQLADTTLDTNQVMLFTEVVTNQGSGYDVTTGMFTAPVAGTYLFTAHLCVYIKQNLSYSIVVDGKELVKGFNYDSGYYPCGTVTATVTLQPSQRVWVKCYSTSHLYQSSSYQWNVFTGVMVHGEV